MGLTRRDLIKIGGTVLTFTALGGIASGSEDFTGNPDRLGMLSDTTRCIGCRRCEKACKIDGKNYRFC